MSQIKLSKKENLFPSAECFRFRTLFGIWKFAHLMISTVPKITVSNSPTQEYVRAVVTVL